MTFEEKTISSEMIYKGAILNLRKDKVAVKNNQTSYREIVEHNGGVTVAAVTGEGKMIMVRQFRKAAGKVILEAPAGKREADEDPRDTAIRELQEETGYTPGTVRFMTKFYSSVGYSEEIIYLYYCTDLVAGETNFDDNEAIDILEYDLSVLYEMVMSGEIEDSKTIVAILMAKQRWERENSQ